MNGNLPCRAWRWTTNRRKTSNQENNYEGPRHGRNRRLWRGHRKTLRRRRPSDRRGRSAGKTALRSWRMRLGRVASILWRSMSGIELPSKQRFEACRRTLLISTCSSTMPASRSVLEPAQHADLDELGCYGRYQHQRPDVRHPRGAARHGRPRLRAHRQPRLYGCDLPLSRRKCVRGDQSLRPTSFAQSARRLAWHQSARQRR